MFGKGEYIMYSLYGCCRIEEITEMDVDNIKKTYYNLKPTSDDHSTIMTPVDNKKVTMRSIISREEASLIFESMDTLDAEDIWIEDRNVRSQTYREIMKAGDTYQLAKVLKMLIVKRYEKKTEGRKFSVTDTTLLKSVEKIFYSELASCLDISPEELTRQIEEQVEASLVKEELVQGKP